MEKIVPAIKRFLKLVLISLNQYLSLCVIYPERKMVINEYSMNKTNSGLDGLVFKTAIFSKSAVKFASNIPNRNNLETGL